MNFNKFQSDQIRKSEYFLKIELNGQIFMREIYPKQKIDFDYLRKLVCELINKPEKINWRSCERTST